MHLSGARGIRVRDETGRWYIDARSSLRTLTLGYGHAGVVQAIGRQASELPFAEVIRYDRPSLVAISYGDALVDVLPDQYTRVRFSTSGSRMVEEAIILSRFIRVSAENCPSRTAIIANSGAWHGTGGIASAASGVPQVHDQAGPLSPDFHHVVANDVSDLEMKIAELHPDRISAVLIEPVLGIRGTFLSQDYMLAVERLCREHGFHLIVDEITTGAGRVGYMSYVESLGVTPDIVVLGKGLTSGYVPIAALAVTEPLYQSALQAMPAPIPHGSTNDAHPLAMAAGLAVLDALRDGSIYANVRATGEWLGGALERLAAEVESAECVGGLGFLHFLRLRRNDAPWDALLMLDVTRNCEDLGLLIDRVGSVVVVSPPLISNRAECEEIIELLGEAVQATEQAAAAVSTH